MKKVFMLAATLALFGTSFANVDNGGKKKKKATTEQCCKQDKCCKKENKG